MLLLTHHHHQKHNVNSRIRIANSTAARCNVRNRATMIGKVRKRNEPFAHPDPEVRAATPKKPKPPFACRLCKEDCASSPSMSGNNCGRWYFCCCNKSCSLYRLFQQWDDIAAIPVAKPKATAGLGAYLKGYADSRKQLEARAGRTVGPSPGS